jgi:hypothetical protein
LFDPTDGVKVSSLGSSFDGVGGVVVEGVPPIVSGVLGSAMGGVNSLMKISSAALSSSTWKLNNSKAISKPLVLVEADPVGLEMESMVVITGVDSMMVGDAVSMSVDIVVSSMVGDAVLMLMVDYAMSMSMVVGDAESTAVAGEESSILVDVKRSVMVGEGASESVDPDLVVPTVGAN